MIDDDWPPISTAPEDGRHVLLYFPDSTDLPVRVGRWSARIEGWYSYSGPIKRRLEQGPTHWAPYPRGPGRRPEPVEPPDPPKPRTGAVALIEDEIQQVLADGIYGKPDRNV